MAPYSPPTGGRAGKLRLDFNENTVGCSPRVIAALHAQLSTVQSRRLSRIRRRQKRHRRAISGVPPDQFVFTNGTDEAIQVFVNTYVDDGQEVLLLKPAYAMYRFYCRSGRRQDQRSRISAARPGVPAGGSCSMPSRPKPAPS